MKKKSLIILTVVGVISIVGGIYAFRLMRKRMTPYNSPTGAEPVVPFVVTKASDFPIKQGSTGGKVVELQVLLGGLTPDGKFGPLTLAALQKYGISQINTQAELDALKSKIASEKAKAGKKSRASELYDAFQSSKARLVILAKNVMIGVISRKAGGTMVYEPNNKNYTSGDAGSKYSKTDIELFDVGTSGNMILKIRDKGFFSVDPNAWSVTEY